MLGKRVTVLMQETHTLERHFGGVAGLWFRELLEEHGIAVVGRDEVARFEGDGERVARVVTAGGRTLPAGAVVCGVGALPDVMLARKAGLELGPLGGIRCDARLRTSARGRLRRGRPL